MIGAQITRASLDGTAASIAIGVRQGLQRIDGLLTGVGTWDTVALQAIGYTAPEAAAMLGVLTALKKVRDVAYGLDIQPTAADVRPFLAALTGID